MTEQQKKLPLHFPKKFLWGVATSAHQVEGSTHNQWSVWELENAKTLAAQAEYNISDIPSWSDIKKDAIDPENYISGKSTQHYRLYEKDFDIVQKMNMNAFRFSIEWSRIEPAEGAWNAEAVQHYKEYIKALKHRNIEPVMTLFHFTLPVWFAEKGGFEKRSNVKYFLRFADKILKDIGTHVRYIVTINEPEIYAEHSYLKGDWPPNKTSQATMLRVCANLAYAHNEVAKLAHKTSRRFRVGAAVNIAYHYPGDDAALTRATAKSAQVANELFLGRIKKNIDWIGLNYYFSNRYYGYRAHNPNQMLSDLGWDMQPENIEHVLERLFVKYGKPIIVTENGVADKDDEYRQWWITKTLRGMDAALQKGIPLEGYLHWSLLDNFEWSYGKWPRFGLLEVDYNTGQRKPRKSAVWFARVLKHLRDV